MSRGEPSSSREPWPRGCAARDRISSSLPISPPGQPQCDDVTGGGRAVRQHHSTRALTRGGNKFLPFWPFWFWVSLWEPGGFPGDSVGKGSSCSAGDTGSIPGSGRSPGGVHGSRLQYPGLENLMDRGAWWLQSTGLQ